MLSGETAEASSRPPPSHLKEGSGRKDPPQNATSSNSSEDANDVVVERIRQLDDLCQQIEASEQNAYRAEGKNLLLLVGKTGAGKTTLIHHMCGKQIFPVNPDDNSLIVVANADDADQPDDRKIIKNAAESDSNWGVISSIKAAVGMPTAATPSPSKGKRKRNKTACHHYFDVRPEDRIVGLKVGHKKESETSSVHVVDPNQYHPTPNADFPLVADSPGFIDTQGAFKDIANNAAIFYAASKAKSVRICLVISRDTLAEGRADNLREILNCLCKLVKNLPKHKDSLSIIVTHVPKEMAQVDENNDFDDFLSRAFNGILKSPTSAGNTSKLLELVKMLSNHVSKSLDSDGLDVIEQFIRPYNPEIQTDSTELWEMLLHRVPIKDPATAFDMPLAEASVKDLKIYLHSLKELLSSCLDSQPLQKKDLDYVTCMFRICSPFLRMSAQIDPIRVFFSGCQKAVFDNYKARWLDIERELHALIIHSTTINTVQLQSLVPALNSARSLFVDVICNNENGFERSKMMTPQQLILSCVGEIRKNLLQEVHLTRINAFRADPENFRTTWSTDAKHTMDKIQALGVFFEVHFGAEESKPLRVVYDDAARIALELFRDFIKHFKDSVQDAAGDQLLNLNQQRESFKIMLSHSVLVTHLQIGFEATSSHMNEKCSASVAFIDDLTQITNLQELAENIHNLPKNWDVLKAFDGAQMISQSQWRGQTPHPHEQVSDGGQGKGQGEGEPMQPDRIKSLVVENFKKLVEMIHARIPDDFKIRTGSVFDKNAATSAADESLDRILGNVNLPAPSDVIKRLMLEFYCLGVISSLDEKLRSIAEKKINARTGFLASSLQRELRSMSPPSPLASSNSTKSKGISGDADASKDSIAQHRLALCLLVCLARVIDGVTPETRAVAFPLLKDRLQQSIMQDVFKHPSGQILRELDMLDKRRVRPSKWSQEFLDQVNGFTSLLDKSFLCEHDIDNCWKFAPRWITLEASSSVSITDETASASSSVIEFESMDSNTISLQLAEIVCESPTIKERQNHIFAKLVELAANFDESLKDITDQFRERFRRVIEMSKVSLEKYVSTKKWNYVKEIMNDLDRIRQLEFFDADAEAVEASISAQVSIILKEAIDNITLSLSDMHYWHLPQTWAMIANNLGDLKSITEKLPSLCDHHDQNHPDPESQMASPEDLINDIQVMVLKGLQRFVAEQLKFIENSSSSTGNHASFLSSSRKSRQQGRSSLIRFGGNGSSNGSSAAADDFSMNNLTCSCLRIEVGQEKDVFQSAHAAADLLDNSEPDVRAIKEGLDALERRFLQHVSSVEADYLKAISNNDAPALLKILNANKDMEPVTAESEDRNINQSKQEEGASAVREAASMREQPRGLYCDLLTFLDDFLMQQNTNLLKRLESRFDEVENSLNIGADANLSILGNEGLSLIFESAINYGSNGDLFDDTSSTDTHNNSNLSSASSSSSKSGVQTIIPREVISSLRSYHLLMATLRDHLLLMKPAEEQQNHSEMSHLESFVKIFHQFSDSVQRTHLGNHESPRRLEAALCLYQCLNEVKDSLGKAMGDEQVKKLKTSTTKEFKACLQFKVNKLDPDEPQRYCEGIRALENGMKILPEKLKVRTIEKFKLEGGEGLVIWLKYWLDLFEKSIQDLDIFSEKLPALVREQLSSFENQLLSSESARSKGKKSGTEKSQRRRNGKEPLQETDENLREQLSSFENQLLSSESAGSKGKKSGTEKSQRRRNGKEPLQETDENYMDEAPSVALQEENDTLQDRPRRPEHHDRPHRNREASNKGIQGHQLFMACFHKQVIESGINELPEDVRKKVLASDSLEKRRKEIFAAFDDAQAGLMDVVGNMLADHEVDEILRVLPLITDADSISKLFIIDSDSDEHNQNEISFESENDPESTVSEWELEQSTSNRQRSATTRASSILESKEISDLRKQLSTQREDRLKKAEETLNRFAQTTKDWKSRIPWTEIESAMKHISKEISMQSQEGSHARQGNKKAKGSPLMAMEKLFCKICDKLMEWFDDSANIINNKPPKLFPAAGSTKEENAVIDSLRAGVHYFGSLRILLNSKETATILSQADSNNITKFFNRLDETMLHDTNRKVSDRLKAYADAYQQFLDIWKEETLNDQSEGFKELMIKMHWVLKFVQCQMEAATGSRKGRYGNEKNFSWIKEYLCRRDEVFKEKEYGILDQISYLFDYDEVLERVQDQIRQRVTDAKAGIDIKNCGLVMSNTTILNRLADYFADNSSGSIIFFDGHIHDPTQEMNKLCQSWLMDKSEECKSVWKTPPAQDSDWRQIRQKIEDMEIVDKAASENLRKLLGLDPKEKMCKIIIDAGLVILRKKKDALFKQMKEIKESGGLTTPDVAANFIRTCKEWSSKLPQLSEEVNNVIKEVFDEIKKEAGNKGVQAIGSHIENCKDTLLLEVLDEHPQIFKSINTVRFNEKARLSAADTIDTLTGDDLDKESLKTEYKKFSDKYKQLIDVHICQGTPTDELVEEIKRSNAGSMQPAMLPILLAKIFALWSAVESDGNYDISKNEQSINRPHPAQVVSIMRLFGIGFESKSSWIGMLADSLEAGRKVFADKKKSIWKDYSQQAVWESGNHLAEIKTGEGKSVTLAILCILFALMGQYPCCVCYSDLLSERDYEAFKHLFELLDVADRIAYSTITNMCEVILNRGKDIREETKKAVGFTKGAKGKANAVHRDFGVNGSVEGLKDDNASKRVLLIDEVDVLFSESFYGRCYNPSVLFQSDETKALVMDMWDRRGQIQNVQDILNSSHFKVMLGKFDGRMQPILSEQISAMWNDLRRIDQHHYEVTSDGNIGYKRNGKISFHHEGFKTMFAYIKEFKKGSISETSMSKHVGISLLCGRYAFASMLKEFGLILGVTGTLADLSKFEKDAMEKNYSIKRSTYLPSIYGSNKLNFKEHDDVKVIPTLGEWHRFIQQQAQTAINKKRSVLIFFETKELVDEFQKTSYCRFQDVKELQRMVEGETKYMDQLVKKATHSGTVTLITRAFGRGIDFVCRDVNVIDNGGVHVIQTFPCDTVTEEVQIRGRTARQGDPGSYEQILFADNLAQGYSLDMQELMDQTKGNGLYQYLCNIRLKAMESRVADREKKVAESNEIHEESMELFKKHLTTVTPATFASLQKIQIAGNVTRVSGSGAKADVTPMHTIVCIDISGSMSAADCIPKGNVPANHRNRLGCVVEATKSFIANRRSRSPSDLISVIAFDSHASLIIEAMGIGSSNIDQILNSVTIRGGTAFDPPIRMARNIIEKRAEGLLAPYIFFLSDGDGTCSQAYDDVAYLRQRNPRFRIDTIVFGPSLDGKAKLEKLAASGGGKFLESVSSAEELEEVMIEASERYF